LRLQQTRRARAASRRQSSQKNQVTMNQIRFDCPGCGQTIEKAEEAQFERVKCPTCQHEFFPDKTRLIRRAPAAPPPESASPAPTPPIQQRAMKLINCPACEKPISPKAESCPFCGHPVKRDVNRDVFAIKIIVIVLALLAFGWVVYSVYEGQQNADKATQILLGK